MPTSVLQRLKTLASTALYSLAAACALQTATAIAAEQGSPAIPACAPPGLVVLNPASTAALVEIEPDPTDAQGRRLNLRFSTQTPQLLALSASDRFLLPPTQTLPTGYQGSVFSVAMVSGDIVISAQSVRSPDLALTPAGSLEVVAVQDALATTRSCIANGSAFDSDFDGTDDSGEVAESCEGTNGAEHGFRFQIADGVEINGLVSVAPFEFDGALELEAFDVIEARIQSQGRISFTGEISAESDAVLPETAYLLGAFPIGTYNVQIGQVGSMVASLSAELFVGACGSISAGTRAGLTSTAITTVGLAVADGELPSIIADVAETDVRVSPPQLDDDAGMDVTLYGGATLRLNVDFTVGNVFPLGGVDIDMVARGSMRNKVDPSGDPWWRISGRPEVYVDLSPQLLTADLSQFAFQVVNPPEQELFSSNSEFPFDLPTGAARSGEQREAGSALRWSRAFLVDEAYTTGDASPTADGGALMVGRSSQFGTALRVDYQGQRLWQRRFEGGVLPQAIHELPDGSVLVGGIRAGALWLLRLDADGNRLWSREYSAAGGDIDTVVIAGAAGNQALLGGRFVNTDGVPDRAPWAARVNAAGSIDWAWRYGQDGLDEEMLGVTATADGGLVLVGESDFTPAGPLLGGSNAYTLRVDGAGDVVWSNVWASSTIDRLHAAVQAPDGSFLVAGSTGGTALDASPRGLMIRYDGDALTPPTAPRWVRGFGGSYDIPDSAFDEITALAAGPKGFTFAGNSRLGNERRAWIGAVAERGSEPDLVWSLFHDGFDQDTVVSLHDIGDGLLMGGSSLSFADGPLTHALWLSRMPYEGYMDWNASAATTALYTPLLKDVPPSYPSFADDLNITGVEDTTLLEQQVAISFAVADSENVTVVPIGFAQAELVREPLGFLDSDGDGISDDTDNCTLTANADQRDTNGDGYGNVCDPDLDDNGVINFADLALLRSVFFTNDPDADFDGDGAVNFLDLAVMRQRFFAAPGPSGI